MRSPRICRLLWKWMWCRWMHNRARCFPEVWGRGLDGPWHCTKCHPCGEEIDMLLARLAKDEKKKKKKGHKCFPVEPGNVH